MQMGDPGAPEGKALTAEDVLMVIHKAAELTGRRRYVIIGTGSMAPIPTAPEYVRLTIDIDIYPIDGAINRDDIQRERNVIADEIGYGTDFVHEHNFYVQPVDSWATAHLPEGWLQRTTVLSTTDGVEAYCLSPVDLCLCKLGAGRPKDIIHIANIFDAGLITEDELRWEMSRVRAKQAALAEKQDRTLEAALAYRAERIGREEEPKAPKLKV